MRRPSIGQPPVEVGLTPRCVSHRPMGNLSNPKLAKSRHRVWRLRGVQRGVTPALKPLAGPNRSTPCLEAWAARNSKSPRNTHAPAQTLRLRGTLRIAGKKRAGESQATPFNFLRPSYGEEMPRDSITKPTPCRASSARRSPGERCACDPARHKGRACATARERQASFASRSLREASRKCTAVA